jgi:hypothetical protein
LTPIRLAGGAVLAGYVNQDSKGWTELWVHGVSGAMPENLLEHPHAVRVDGSE